MEELRALLDQIGVSNEEKNSCVEALQQEVKLVCTRHVTNQRARKQNLVEHVESLSAKIAECQRRLGQAAETTVINQTLSQEVATRTEELRMLQEKEAGRRQMLNDKLAQLDEVCLSLGYDKNQQDVDRENLSTENLKQVDEKIFALSKEKAQKLEQSKAVAREIVSLWTVLGMSRSECTQQEEQIWMLSDRLPVTEQGMQGLVDMKQALVAEKLQRETTLREHTGRIAALWDRLKVQDAERSLFFSKTNGIGRSAIIACEQELNRLEALKGAMLKQLVLEVREKILVIWEELHFSEDERKQTFGDFFIEAELATDQLLDSHEEFLKALEAKQLSLRPVLKLIGRRDEIVAQKDEQDRQRADSTRLLSRNENRDPGRLLREEKIRNMIEKELPKVTEKLLAAIGQWEQTSGETLTYDGKVLKEVLESDIATEKQRKEAEKARKEKEKQAKKAAEVGGGVVSEPHGSGTPGAAAKKFKAAASLVVALTPNKNTEKAARSSLTRPQSALPSGTSCASTERPSTAPPRRKSNTTDMAAPGAPVRSILSAIPVPTAPANFVTLQKVQSPVPKSPLERSFTSPCVSVTDSQ
eukprot:GILK01004018.1.p1 GENE.GILK01004018.1~~GILK01004018.1.p1  ORF type:complete len:607 (-),score=148.82 GILK01004018.1:135-1892(-)